MKTKQISLDLQTLAANRVNGKRASCGIGGAFLFFGLLASGPAQAAICGVTGGSIFPYSGTCAEVRAAAGDQFGGFEGNPIPPNYGYSPVGGTANVIAGYGAGDATATANAQLGLLRLTAQSSYGSTDPNAFAFAEATAAFADAGTITLPGGTIGDLVHAFVTVDIQGTKSGGSLGIIDSHLNFKNSTPGNIYNNFGVDFPNGVYQFDAHIGDDVYVSLGFTIFSAASTMFPFSSADYGNSAHVYLDFQEPGVYFNSVSGHDYSSAAAVPEPSNVLLLAVGLAGLGGRLWVRRKAAV
jgi:hypothetical protein